MDMRSSPVDERSHSEDQQNSPEDAALKSE